MITPPNNQPPKHTNSLATSPSVIVIGAGIVGISTAIWLQRYGCQVTIIDKQVTQNAASYGNAGVLAQSSVVPVTTPGLLSKAPKMLFSTKEPLFLRWSYLLKLMPWLRKYLAHCNHKDVLRISKALYPLVSNSLQNHQDLANGTAAENFVKPDDYLFLYQNRASFEADAYGWNLRENLGYQWQELEGKAVAEYDPALSGDNNFLVRFNDHGRIPHPGKYIQALTTHAVKAGARLITGMVDDFVIENQHVKGVVTQSGETVKADKVAITSGVWSGKLSQKLGLNIPLESERGYHLELINPSCLPRSPVMVASGKFVMTPMEDRLRLAGIVEFGGLKAPAASAPHNLLLNNIRALLPGITWDSADKWLGHRPAPVDSIPLIGRIKSLQNIYIGCGHHHVGLTAGPRTGQLLAQQITQQATDIDLAVYSPDRFSD